jgi:cytochrome b
MLLIFRVAWGIVGSITARFSNFVTGPRAVIDYLKALIRGNRSLHAGHNPAGGWMVVVLMTSLVI